MAATAARAFAAPGLRRVAWRGSAGRLAPWAPAAARTLAAAAEAREAEPESGAAARRRRPVRLLTTAEQCEGLVERLLSADQRSVALDCEGPQLGRFGRLSLVQLATDQEIVLVDVLAGGAPTLEALTPLLESREVIKVFHDCREDSSLLFHQHSANLAAVYDTQVAFGLWLERKGLDAYQAGLPEVVRTFLIGAYRSHNWSELERKPVPPARWLERPLKPQALRYAVEGVAHLLPLQRRLCRELGDANGDFVIQRSTAYIGYAHLNGTLFTSPDVSHLRPGAPLSAMLASRRPDSAYFKVNHGALTGVVREQKDLEEFQDLQPGDIAPCVVKSLSECQQFVTLQREGHGELMFDFRRREMRRLPSLEEAEKMFPSRASSMYGFGVPRGGGGPSLVQEPSTYRAEKPAVLYKTGKRGAVKVRDTGIKAPKKQKQTRSF